MISAGTSTLRLRRLQQWAAAALPLVYIALFFAVPVGYLLIASLRTASTASLLGEDWTIANYSSVLGDPFYQQIIARTLMSALAVLAVAVLIGYPVAYRVSRMSARLQAIFLLLMLFPLMVSNVIRAYGWIAILGRRGVVNGVLLDLGAIERPLSLLYSVDAVILGLLTILLPYMVISLVHSLTAIDRSYREAAAALGASPRQTFMHVTLPLSLPGLVSGMLLVFLLTLSAYVTITLLGGPRFKVLVSTVFDSVQTFQWGQAGALAFILLALALAVSAVVIAVLRPHRVQGRG